MRKRLAARLPSPALSVALVALFVALAGTSYATFAVPVNSVGTAQLKNGAVTGPKLAAQAVTGANVVPASITGRDIAVQTLHMVPTARYAIAAGILEGLTFERFHYVNPPGIGGGATLPCPPGQAAISGGIEHSDPLADTYVDAPYSTTTGFGPGGTPNAWTFATFNHDSSADDSVHLWTLCATARGVTGF